MSPYVCIVEMQKPIFKSTWFVIVLQLLFYVSLLIASAQASHDKIYARIEVDQSATKVLREWIADSSEQILAIRIESPNLEYAFRVNGQIVGEWQGADSLSKGYSDEEYRSTNYDFKVTIVYERKTNKNGETTIFAKSKIRIATGKGLGVHLSELKSEFSVPKPQDGVLFFDSEWFKKTKPWNEEIRKRSDDDLITIWRVKFNNVVNRKVVNADGSPGIELVARLIR